MLHSPSQTNATLETNQPLSQSILWQLQRNFFAQQGINAWNHNTVPHYITSNPTIAHAYAKVTLGFLRDWLPTLDPTHPIYILELGAGSGRFAYHFLKKFWATFPHSTLGHLKITYILSDLSERNLHYWHTHPFLQPYFQQGILDVAQFDAQKSKSLHLRYTNQTHTTLKNPLIILANYFFDCLPQDAFTLKNNQLHASLVNLSLPQESGVRSQKSDLDLNEPDLIHRLKVTYTDRLITPNYYPEPTYNQLLHHYQQRLTDTTVLLPIMGLRCLDNLRHLSQNRLLFISGDKGYSKLDDLNHRPKPSMVFHGGCFSLMVNYHALGQHITNIGGQALHTPHHHSSLNISAFLCGQPPSRYDETLCAYHDAIVTHSPDDYFQLKKALDPHSDRLTLQQAIAYIRLSGGDAKIFLACLPALNSYASSATNTQRQDLIQLIHQIWDIYYPIGEPHDLAYQSGKLLLRLKDYRNAAEYLQKSLKLQGLKPETLYHLGQCYQYLGEMTASRYCMDKILKIDPTFTAAH